MRRRWIFPFILAVFCCLSFCGAASAETRITVNPETVGVGGIVDVTVETDEGAVSVVYDLKRNGEPVFHGEGDTHFSASFRPREEGKYTLEAEVLYENGNSEKADAAVTVSGSVETVQGPENVYSQKDGWWKDKTYSKSELEKSGCAIFTLSHALQRMGWTGEEIDPAELAAANKNCYTKNGTANARLIYNASQIYGYTTKSALQKDKKLLKAELKSGDLFSFSIVNGHIALMCGVDEKNDKVRIADSAPSATFERIRKGSVYYLQDGKYVEAKDPGEIPGARYYFETGYYGGMEYWMDLEYCARRGGRLIRPSWLFVTENGKKTGAVAVSLTSGESEVSVNGEIRTVATRDLIWGTDGRPRMAVVKGNKTVRLTDAEGRRIASLPPNKVLPALETDEDRVLVIYKEERGYLSLKDAEVTAPLEEIHHGVISVNGNTSGRATVKMRCGASDKEKIADSWKTGTPVIPIRQEGDFWLVEGKGVRLWVQQDYLTIRD